MFWEHTWIYRELDDAASRAAGHLMSLGLSRGDRVRHGRGELRRRQVRAHVLQLDATAQAADDLAAGCVERFADHENAEIITSFPDLGELTGARILAETGDDRSRFADGRTLHAYAGSAPITRVSGTVRIPRSVRPLRPLSKYRGPARTGLAQPLQLFLGQLRRCLITRQSHDENTAFLNPLQVAA